ncbi:hypothetical protein CP8484711_0509, partial [Chlamydia psittaci 84-8471/1]
ECVTILHEEFFSSH